MFFSRNFAHCALLVIYRSAIHFVDASDGPIETCRDQPRKQPGIVI